MYVESFLDSHVLVEHFMADGPPSVSPGVTGDGACVADDTSCLRCGYNLRTLAVESVCPECGTDVAISLRGDRLQFSDPLWLGDIIRGVRLMARMYLVAVICIGLLWLLGVLASERVLSGGQALYAGVCAGMVVLTFAYLALLIGLWLFTVPEPNYIGPRSLRLLQRVIRWATLAGVIASLTFIVSARTSRSPVPALLVAVATTLISALATLLYIRLLAMRLPAPGQAGAAKALLIGLLITTPVMTAGVLVIYTRRAVGSSPAFALLGCSYMAGFLLALAYTALLFKLRRALEQALAEARRLADTASEARVVDSGRP